MFFHNNKLDLILTNCMISTDGIEELVPPDRFYLPTGISVLQPKTARLVKIWVILLYFCCDREDYHSLNKEVVDAD